MKRENEKLQQKKERRLQGDDKRRTKVESTGIHGEQETFNYEMVSLFHQHVQNL
jgi:hypothetical protein